MGQYARCHQDFNPRSRMGSDDAEGANQEKSHHFNPRSRMGSDHPHDVFQYVSSIFQSTLPHGERPLISINHAVPRFISIHAPAWGATPRYLQNPQNEVYFNPRSRMGSDHALQASSYVHHHFNPRSRMGSDQLQQPMIMRSRYFNPRSRMGSDTLRLSKLALRLNFNPRSRMGSDAQ